MHYHYRRRGVGEWQPRRRPDRHQPISRASRLDLVLKPDPVAPGSRVVSLDDSTSPPDGCVSSEDGVLLSDYTWTGCTVRPNDYYRLLGALAASVAAGAAALMLQGQSLPHRRRRQAEPATCGRGDGATGEPEVRGGWPRQRLREPRQRLVRRSRTLETTSRTGELPEALGPRGRVRKAGCRLGGTGQHRLVGCGCLGYHGSRGRSVGGCRDGGGLKPMAVHRRPVPAPPRPGRILWGENWSTWPPMRR